MTAREAQIGQLAKERRGAARWPLRSFAVSRAAAALAFLGLCLAASDVAAQGDLDNKSYVLGPGDLVRVAVYEQPDLETEARVSGTNDLSFPLLGEVRVGGGTVRQAEEKIAQGLRSGGFLASASVTILVLEFDSQRVSVLGQVNAPGSFVLKKPSTVIDMLAQAADVNPEGDDIAYFIQKGRGGQPDQQVLVDLKALFEEGDLAQNRAVADGDVIFVPKAPVFYIYGEVNRPGSYRLERNMTVMQALSLGGGITAAGSEGGVTVRRTDGDGGVTTIEPELADLVEEDDVIYVEESLF